MNGGPSASARYESEKNGEALRHMAFGVTNGSMEFEERASRIAAAITYEAASSFALNLGLPEVSPEKFKVFGQIAYRTGMEFESCFDKYGLPKTDQAEHYDYAVNSASPRVRDYLPEAASLIGISKTKEELLDTLRQTTLRDWMKTVALSLGYPEFFNISNNCYEFEIRDALRRIVPQDDYFIGEVETVSIGPSNGDSPEEYEISEARKIRELAASLANAAWKAEQPFRGMWGRKGIIAPSVWSRDQSRIDSKQRYGVFDSYARFRDKLFHKTLDRGSVLDALVRVAFELYKDQREILREDISLVE